MIVRYAYHPTATAEVCLRHWRDTPDHLPALGEVMDARRAECSPECEAYEGPHDTGDDTE